MTEDPNTSTATQLPPSTPVKKKGGKGCWLWGCGTVFVLFLLMIGGILALSMAFKMKRADLDKVVEADVSTFMDSHPGVIVEEKRFVVRDEKSAQYVIRYRESADGPESQLTQVYTKEAGDVWLGGMSTTTSGANITTSVSDDGTVTTSAGSGANEAPVADPATQGEPPPSVPQQ